MYRTLIVPLDGSARSQGALPVAARLAHACDATLELVRVHLSDRPDLDSDPSWDDMFRQGQRQYLASLAEAYEPIAGRRVVTALLDPPVVDALCEYASSRPAPLVVMTARGRTGMRRALLGSVSDGVVRHGSGPVLMLQDGPGGGRPRSWNGTDHPLRTIVVPLDGTTFAEAGVAHAVAMARVTGATVHLIRVIGLGPSGMAIGEFAMQALPPFDEAELLRNDLAHEYLQGMVDRITAGGRRVDITTEVALSAQTGTAIAESCRRHGADLVVMATHGRGGSRLLVGAVADQLLKDGPGAILFVRPTNASLPAGLRTKSRARQRADRESDLAIPVDVY